MAEVLHVLGEHEAAQELLTWHATSDEPGDEHHGQDDVDFCPTLADTALALEDLAAASSRHDLGGYRAALTRAARAHLTEEQVQDSWHWGWTRRRDGHEKPPFDHHGNVTA